MLVAALEMLLYLLGCCSMMFDQCFFHFCFMHMGVLLICRSMCMQYPQRPEIGTGSSGTELTDRCELLCRCGELKH